MLNLAIRGNVVRENMMANDVLRQIRKQKRQHNARQQVFLKEASRVLKR